MKCKRLIGLTIALVAIGLLAIAIFHERDPRYEGRTLSEWIGDVGPRGTYIGPVAPFARRVPAARHAIKQMAPDAIPVLLEWAQAKDSMLRAEICELINGKAPFHFDIKSSFNYNMMAWRGFSLLGNEAKTAWPALVQLTNDKDWEHRYWAFLCLAATKPDKETLIPVLPRLIHDPEKIIQDAASRVFHAQFPQDAESAGLYKMFPELKDVPTNNAGMNPIWEMNR